MSILNKISSDWMRTKHTPIRIMVYFSPIIYPILMLWYSSFSRGSELWQLNIHSIFSQGLGLLLPMVVALLTTLVVQQEEQAASFIGLLAEPVSRKSIYVSKLLMVIFITIIDLLLATAIFLVGMKFVLHIENIYYIKFFESALLLALGTLFLYGFHLIVAFMFGVGPNIVIGSIGLIAAGLMATGLGDGIWQYIPWAWPIRLGGMIGATFPEYSYSSVIANYFNSELLKGVVPAVVLFILVLIIGSLWFERWEGRKED